MGMVLDNADVMFIDLTKKERLKAVLSQFVDPNDLDFCVENVWNLLELNWYNEKAPLPMKADIPDISQIDCK